VLAALRALELRRIALFSPYVEATHTHEIAFLNQAGIEVVGGRCLGLAGGDQYILVTPEEWLHMAEADTSPLAEGAFLSCTNIHASEIVEPLERALGRPVVTSNQAVLWWAMRTCGLADNVAELGGLFRVREVEAVSV
jgi:maleate isomerase